MSLELTKIKRVFSSDKKRASVIIIAGILVAATIIGFNISTTDAINTCASGFQVNPGTWWELGCYSPCQRVTNNASSSVFVPTATSAEWSSFINNPPSGTSLSSCAGGCTVGAYCGYIYHEHVTIGVCNPQPVYNVNCAIVGPTSGSNGYTCEHRHAYVWSSSCTCTVYSYNFDKTETYRAGACVQ